MMQSPVSPGTNADGTAGNASAARNSTTVWVFHKSCGTRLACAPDRLPQHTGTTRSDPAVAVILKMTSKCGAHHDTTRAVAARAITSAAPELPSFPLHAAPLVLSAARR
jgi:hypothetical protein